MTKDELIALAKTIAKKFSLNPALVCAVCHHESDNWKQYAVRHEPAFYDKYVKDKPYGLTEKVMRATSFGLMQIMGQVAREQGFTGDYLTELLEPELNITQGCAKLARCMDRSNGDTNTALLLYNGGGNKDYPTLVLRHLKEYQ